jgi:hypothetical protein
MGVPWLVLSSWRALFLKTNAYAGTSELRNHWQRPRLFVLRFSAIPA